MERVILTVGEPAGIGPDILLKIAQRAWSAELVAVSDPALLAARAKQLQLPFKTELIDIQQPPQPHTPGTLKIIPLSLNTPSTAGRLDPANADFVLRCLRTAADYCLEHKASALVTGPVHKATLNEAGFAFSGHTEFFAQHCGVPQTLMLFVVDQLKVALATTHIPLADVPKTITKEHLLKTTQLLHQELQHWFGIHTPNILVCGLNPHAGEAGHLGREEIEVIRPVLEQLRGKGIQVTGPFPADTIFIEKYLKTADAILAMYHDQALPVIKYTGFDRAVNVTLGLPFIRISVDHGTALDIAGSGTASAESLAAAVRLAMSLY
jgi:4-hydroxythreonine-4-phosphate dehydrogenase